MEADKETQNPGKISGRRETRPKDKNGKNHLAFGIGLGLLFGTALGAALDNLALWLPIGMCLGIAIAAAQAEKQKK